jgi:TonB family protein
MIFKARTLSLLLLLLASCAASTPAQTAQSPKGDVDKLLKSLPEGSVLKGYCTAKFCRKVEGAEYEFKVLKNPAPAYTAAARAAGASGQVVVRIVADEEGRVVAAQGMSGHPVLRESAAAAARRMRVSPVKSKDGNPSKFTGVVVYTFVVR